jgi:magnesium transporter
MRERTGRHRGKFASASILSRTRQTKVPGSGVALAGDVGVVAAAGGLTAIQETMDEVVSVEDPSGPGPVPDAPAAPVAWLFQGDTTPVRVPVDALETVVADDDNFVWIDLGIVDERQLREVGAALGLHRNAVHAALSPWHRPSLVVYPEHFLVSATLASLDPGAYRVHAAQLDLIVGHNYLFTIHKAPLPFEERVLARAWNSPDLVRLDSAFMLYIVLDELLAYYENLNRHLQGEIERLEERALRDTSDTFLENLIHFKRYAFALSHLADQHWEVFAAFLRPDFRWICGADVEVYFRDLETRLSHLLDNLVEAKDAVNGAFEIYVSHMSHRTNQVIKVLTMASTTLLPATDIIGLFGSSLSTSVRGFPVDSPVGFMFMLIAIVAVSGGSLWGFRRQGWI